MKIVINKCFGGFGLSGEGLKLYKKLKGSASDMKICDYYILRNDPALIKVVEILGKTANDSYSNLEIIEIPDHIDWIIEEYDGDEWVAEKHRTWS